MRILCFIDHLGPGGAQRQMVGLAKLLKDQGFEVRVITYFDIPFYLKYLEDNGVNYENIKKASGSFLRIYYIRSAIRKYSPDWVISFLDTPSIIVSFIRMLGLKYKLIVSERNTTQKLNWRELLKLNLYRFADAIVTNSYSQENFLTGQFPFLKEKVATITNFTDTDYFKPVPNRLNGKHEIYKILTVGRIAPQKNAIRYIQAVHTIVNKGYLIEVKWYGSSAGYEDYFKQCLGAINKYGLQRVFNFFPATSNILEIYQGSDLFCLPSVYEGTPNVICEAMSCGKPVLCGEVGDNPVLVKHGRNGFLFDPDKEEDIADKIIEYINLTNHEKLAMGQTSRDYALDILSAERFIMQYIDIIQKL